MALEVVYGEPRNRALAKRVAESVVGVGNDGTIYLGYPVLATADERVHVDVLLVSREHGLVAFQVSDGVPTSGSDWQEAIEDQDRLYSVLDSHLGRHDQLRRGRSLGFEIQTVTVFPDPVTPPETVQSGHYVSFEEVEALVISFPGLDEPMLRTLESALQRVTTIKPAKRRSNVSQRGSRGAVLKEIEKGIANLDRWQKQAAIETPEGPQRIRGLAGSGKTIVLALKAAYLHTQHPDWQIAVTFQTRALYQQFEDLITRFTFEHSSDKPDYKRLQIVHAWGATEREGIYRSIARHVNVPFRDYNYASSTFGRGDAFAAVCRELLELTETGDHSPLFDAVLIDEAQDLPTEFFRLVQRFTKEPKRIVWAFDELQNLSESAMPTTDELFGTDSAGEPLVTLAQSAGEARHDVVLRVCYRNSPWALATAHALGFGIYREGGLVQHFDDVTLWEEIGYRVTHGRLQQGRRVELERSQDSYPPYFPNLLRPDDAILSKAFESEAAQDDWVTSEILKNLNEDELDFDDILVVIPDAYTSKRRASRLATVLAREGIQSHLVGVGSSVDEVFVSSSIAIAHIHRAKGNEAPMVYVLDSQYGSSEFNIVSRRNTLFTGITRSRAWVRICGWGERFEGVITELESVRDKEYRLAFRVPTPPELATLRRIHRERSEGEVAGIRKHARSLAQALEALERGELDLQDLPASLRTRLMRLIELDRENGDEQSY